jgi:hypothetical protein
MVALNGVTSKGNAFYSGNIFKLSLPLRQQPTISSATISLSWTSLAGQTYQVECCPDLALPIWSALGAPIIATGRTVSASDTIGGGPRRFYRVSLLP